jgi:hypothetical protein
VGGERAQWPRLRAWPQRFAVTTDSTSGAAKAVVRRNTEEVQGKGAFDVFDYSLLRTAPFAFHSLQQTWMSATPRFMNIEVVLLGW